MTNLNREWDTRFTTLTTQIIETSTEGGVEKRVIEGPARTVLEFAVFSEAAEVDPFFTLTA